MPKYLFVHTIGCQMNIYDSEQIVIRLSALGYQQTSCLEKADIVIGNSCSIRAKAEQKTFSFLGRLERLKAKKPGLILGIGGCVAQQEGAKLLKRFPHLDLVFGTQAIDRLIPLIQKIEEKRCRIVDVAMTERLEQPDAQVNPGHNKQVSRFVTIMQGCENFCTYCIVPYVRGRETSRDPASITTEINRLVQAGVKEVTLLGQNVNSYGKKEGLCSFPELLSQINSIEGLERIRFTTSHPKDLDDGLIRAFGTYDKLCDHIHLPIQSGSNRVLKRMNRKYTRELYLDKVAKLRDTCPEIAITSDIIVGFPGEMDTDFDETLELIKAVQFDGIFAFMYSDRPSAPAARFNDKVSKPRKRARLQILLDSQKDITRMKNQATVGSVQSILTEGFSKRQPPISLDLPHQAGQWTGRASTNKIVHFYQIENSERCGDIVPGKLVDVKIEKAFSHSLWGTPIKARSTAEGLEGENIYAA
jgi:tRNA-2-methylthio-N6-dimethylallyladenosine synthase